MASYSWMEPELIEAGTSLLEAEMRFCFRPTHKGPSFLLGTKDRRIDSLFDDPETRWHVHTL
tara:strand:+ start:36 stop:221 length:186 start_codon:yes stop_codon:yes gene_type:complete